MKEAPEGKGPIRSRALSASVGLTQKGFPTTRSMIVGCDIRATIVRKYLCPYLLGTMLTENCMGTYHAWRQATFVQFLHLPELRCVLSSGQSRSWA